MGKFKDESDQKRRMTAIRNAIRKTKEPEDLKDIRAASIAVYEKLGTPAVMELFGKFGARDEFDLSKDEYPRFLRLAKDYLNSV